MDEKQKQLMRMQQYQYAPQLPFYMSYPQNMYMTELEYERDMERMKELYPKRMKQLLAYVEEECDKMEYEGSLMYDEYPDKVLLYRTAVNIYDKAVPMQGTERRREPRDRDYMDVIQALLFDEIYRRRGRRRRCCRRWW